MNENILEFERLLPTLAPLLTWEREAQSCSTMEEYQAYRRRFETLNRDGLELLRQYVEDRPHWTLADMQNFLAFLLRHPDLIFERSDEGTVRALADEAWNGLRGWRA